MLVLSQHRSGFAINRPVGIWILRQDKDRPIVKDSLCLQSDYNEDGRMSLIATFYTMARPTIGLPCAVGLCILDGVKAQ